MISKGELSALENMCRERAAVAKKEMEYWLAEAEEWKRFRNCGQPPVEEMHVQLDWCAEFSSGLPRA
jgi:hypothetical protein